MRWQVTRAPLWRQDHVRHPRWWLKQPPVGGDRPSRSCVQALIAHELDGGRVGQPRPQQAGLPLVVTDDDRLARGHTFLNERHDQGGELGVGGIEACFVEVAHVAAGSARSHHDLITGDGMPLTAGHRARIC